MRIKKTPHTGFTSFFMMLQLCLFIHQPAVSQHFKSVSFSPNVNFVTNYIPVYCCDSNTSYLAYDATAFDSVSFSPIFFFNHNNTINLFRNISSLDSLLVSSDIVFDEDSSIVNESTYDTVAMAYLYALYDAESEKMVNKYAEMVETEPEEIKNLPLYRFIDHWYGVRYKYGGTTRKGIDCSAFSQRLYGNVYCLNIKRTSKQQFKKCEHLDDLSDVEEGDLVFFRINRIRISHVGVYLANGYFVHATRSRGIMISSINDKYWQRRFAGCGRVNKPYAHNTESKFID